MLRGAMTGSSRTWADRCPEILADPPRVLVIDNHDSYTWNLVQLLWEVGGAEPCVVRNDEASAEELLRESFTHVVLSPGPGTPERSQDFGLCRRLIELVEVPCLGVCLGHQGIGIAAGARLARAVPMHGRRSRITHDGTHLFRGIPQGFLAVRYHSLALQEPIAASLHRCAIAEDGAVMAVRDRRRPLYGVQFHPESIETEHGEALIRNFLGGATRKPLVAVRPSPRVREARSAPSLHWRELPAQGLTPPELFRRVFGQLSHSFWLDGGADPSQTSRWSFLGGADDESLDAIRAFGRDRCEIVESGKVTAFEGSVWSALETRLAAARVDATDCPAPLAGGYVGYISYEASELVPARDDGRPVAELVRATRYVAHDHRSGRWLAIVLGSRDELTRWCDEIASRCAESTAQDPHVQRETPRSRVTGDLGVAGYRARFDTVQEWLRAGESYEACLTYAIEGSTDADPLSLYERVRVLNPAPFSAFLRMGERRILCTSPERFLTADREGRVETKPIKGTAPRHSDPESDRVAVERLRSDPKTRSENLMIADLLRNDLGRVCEVGTVHVPSLMSVESYASVHQLVTTVRGRLRAETSPIGALHAMFPGGSMTGAPKERTVRLLSQLEGRPRGVYSGTLGYQSFSGEAEWSIVIRTLVLDGERFSIGVGGAITVLSDVDSEYAETRLKARLLLDALGLDDYVAPR